MLCTKIRKIFFLELMEQNSLILADKCIFNNSSDLILFLEKVSVVFVTDLLLKVIYCCFLIEKTKYIGHNLNSIFEKYYRNI
jgi:hypothetical protein